jgi:hypothetical protein
LGKKRARLDLNNEAPEVVSHSSTEKEPWKKERLRTIRLLLKTDQSYEEVASIIGRYPSRIKE